MKKLIVLILFALLSGACSDPKQEVHKYSFFAFGTIIELTISGVEKELADQAASELEIDFEQMHKDWHAWQPSPLVTINEHLARGEAAPVDEKILPLLIRAKELASLSLIDDQQSFNPAMGGLLDLWGYHGDDAPSQPPEKKSIDNYLKQAPDLATLELDEGQVRADNPAIQFDLGGFAKGYGIDRAIDHLKEMGIENAIVNAGGDLKVIGKRHDRLWRIGIRNPRKAGIMASLDVNDGESVFTSGDYERYFMHEGKRYHHILDPRTGSPASEFISVTIITQDITQNAALADAAATALFVAGKRNWEKVADQMGIDKAMVVESNGQIHMTTKMKPRMLLTVEEINAQDR